MLKTKKKSKNDVNAYTDVKINQKMGKFQTRFFACKPYEKSYSGRLFEGLQQTYYKYIPWVPRRIEKDALTITIIGKVAFTFNICNTNPCQCTYKI